MKKFLLSCLLYLAISALSAKEISILVPSETPIPYGLARLQVALKLQGVDLVAKDSRNATLLVVSSAEEAIRAGLDPGYYDDATPEGFIITRQGIQTVVVASDARGAMYALLELADQVQSGRSPSQFLPKKVIPRLAFRAIKFNLPQMAYRSDASISQHTATCTDIRFWEKYLDMMVENRYNVLSLWSLHLFHYMVIPEHFPEASQFNQVEMAEYKKLWSGIFRMAKERGIETYIINWNTFVSPSFARAHQVGAYTEVPSHFGEGDTSLITEQYTREIIRQVIDEYPDLTGLGITLGERMGGQNADQRRAWLDRTIFAGMRDASRKIKFVYRAPLSANSHSGGSTSEENDLRTRQQIEGLDTEGPVWVEFKYNWSHGHSSPNLFIVHGGKLTDKYRVPEPTAYQYIWTVRNEDFYVHRWGQPDFVRQFIQNNGASYVGGCFIGSEVFIPALDYVSKEGPHKTWEYSYERLWLWYSVWGRLMYDENTPDDFFAGQLERRYGKGTGAASLKAWKSASSVPLHFASFRQGRNDLSLYTEGFCGYAENKSIRFFDINRFSTAPVLDTLRYLNITDYVKQGHKAPEGVMSPLALADSLDDIHEACMSFVNLMSRKPLSPTTQAEIADIEAWAWFAKYFADKLRAGVAMMNYRILGQDQRELAVTYLEACVGHWTHYADATTKFNQSTFLFHTKDVFDWYGALPLVRRDVELARMDLGAVKRAGGEKIGGYLFAHMTNDEYGSLHYALSEDGLHWTEANGGKAILDSYLGHPDMTVGHDGRIYLVGNPPEGGKIRIWASQDYLNWEVVTDISPDMSSLPEFAAPTKWHGAPKMYYDQESGTYVITWHSSTSKKSEVEPDTYWGNMRTLVVTTFDFSEISQPERLFSDDIATIDAIIRKDGYRFTAIFKDERAPSDSWLTGKTIRTARSTNPEGPFYEISEAISPNFREAPTVIPQPDGSGFYLYYEQYPGLQYEMSVSDHLEGPWYQAYNQTFSVPDGARHGCMIPISAAAYQALANTLGVEK